MIPVTDGPARAQGGQIRGFDLHDYALYHDMRRDMLFLLMGESWDLKREF